MVVVVTTYVMCNFAAVYTRSLNGWNQTKQTGGSERVPEHWEHSEHHTFILCCFNPNNIAEISVYKPWRTEGFCQFEIIINV